MKEIWLSVFLLILASHNASASAIEFPFEAQVQGQSDLTSSLIDVPVVDHYKLRLVIDPEHHSLSGQADLSVRNSAARRLTVIPVLLYRLMDVEAASDAQGKTLPFIQKVLKFPDNQTWQANSIQVTLPTPLAPGQTAMIRLKYAGPLFGYREVMAYVKDTISEDYSLIRAETMAYPMVAAPSYAGWRQFYGNKFDYDIETVVPAGLVAVCSGDEVGEPETQGGKSTYRCSGPPGSSQINVAIAKFRVLDDPDRKLRVYVLQADAEAGNQVMTEMRRALDFYRSYFGSPPRIGAMGAHVGLTLIEIPDGWGSYGLRGHIFQSAAAFKDPKNAPELYHEVSHLWNAMASDRVVRTRWFDEAFASYFETLAVRQFQGAEAFHALLESYRETFSKRVARDPRGRTTPIADYSKEELGVFSYSKGAWSLYVLHEFVGEQQFREIIRTFLSEFADKPADLKDFQRVAERVSHRDLGKYFNEWIYGAASSQLLLDKIPISEIVKRY
jgi:hypothetical protein